MIKLLTIFFIIILFVSIFFLISNKYEAVSYELETNGSKAFGYCFRFSCWGMIETNTTINDIKEIGG